MIRRTLHPVAAALAAGLVLGAPAAGAESDKPKDPLSGEAIERELEALSQDAERALQRFFTIVEPFARRLAESIADLPRYAAPEILPNGDILIRRLPARASDEGVDQTEL